MAEEFAAEPVIEIEGSPLSEEIALRLESAVVDDHLFLPDMFVLRLRDPDHDLISKGGFDIGAVVEILAGPQGQEATETLILGEITALEAEFDSTGSHAVVRGYDHSHRFHRGRTTETYRNVTDSDIVRKVVQRAGLEAGRIDETTTVHRHVSQANVTDWEFLSARAREVGQEIAVVDGKVDFRKPPDASAAPSTGDLSSTDALQLVLGGELELFRPRLTSSEQVKEVQVRGWDPSSKQAIVATAPATTTSASLPLTPADLAGVFGDPVYVAVDRAFSSQNEVDAAVKAIAEQIASSFAEAEGVAKGNPKLRSGAAISVALTGAPFEGMYTITSSQHVFDQAGYKTHFSVTGRQERSLLGLASRGATNGAGSSSGPPIYGVVIAQVTSVNDPDKLGRVKLSFPWLSDSYETDWVRAVQWGAGKDRGFVVVPEVNDEVLVAFEHGDVRKPYVLGGLYNGVDKPRLGDGFIDGSTGQVQRRGFVSRKGHSIVFFDGDDDEGIALISASKGLRVSLNQSETTIKISSDGEVSIEGSGKVAVKGKQLELSSDSGVSIDGGSGNVTIKGRQIQLN